MKKILVTVVLGVAVLAAAKDVDRPIFYSVAVIIAGYLPIYALAGPSGNRRSRDVNIFSHSPYSPI